VVATTGWNSTTEASLSKEIAALFAKRFIARPDVKAVQFDADAGTFHRGDWFPDSKIDPARRPNSPHLPHGFKMAHLLAHIAGERTYGHYMLGESDMCKMFAFDIDLWQPSDDAGNLIPGKYQQGIFVEMETHPIVEVPDVRAAWQSRAKEDADFRTHCKWQMKMLAHILATKVVELDIDCAVAYSGSKGVHVYGFMAEPMPAAEVRAAAIMVMEMADEFELLKGKHFFRHKNQDPETGFPNFTIEVFPKQVTLEGKDLGNLMRLPLGKNWKNPNDPTFFLDMTSPLAQFKPVLDPVALLTNGNPFV
jgi:hypothetical protein